MDPNTPPSFMSLLDGDDAPQGASNNVASTPPTQHHSPYYPPSYPPFPYHPYHQPPPHLMHFSGGSTQNSPNFPPHYYPPPNNEVHNVPPTEYPYYPYYPPPPTNSNYLSVGSTSTPSSTPTGPIGESRPDVETVPDEGDAEEVVERVVSAKKWSLEEDKRLIRSWINIGTDAVVGSDQKKSSFWKRVAETFNEHRPRGASIRSWKTLNGRWSRCSPLVSKWAGILLEVERSNHSGWNDSMIVEHAQKLFIERDGKRFELEHWYDMLKDQPKWRRPHNPTTNVGSGSSKRTHSEAEEGDDDTVAPTDTPEEGVQRPEGRKAAKRRVKDKATNNIIDIVTKQMNDMSSSSGAVDNAFLKFIDRANEEKAHKQMIRDEKIKLERERLKLDEDRIMIMDTSGMAPDQVAYIQLRRAEILNKRMRESASSP